MDSVAKLKIERLSIWESGVQLLYTSPLSNTNDKLGHDSFISAPRTDQYGSLFFTLFFSLGRTTSYIPLYLNTWV